MLDQLDHVGYLARDLERAVAELSRSLGASVVRHFDRPEFALRGTYLGWEKGTIEVFTFTDAELLAARLAGQEVVLEHVAYEIHDIDRVALEMRRRGVRFAGPDLRGELREPVELSGVRHLWTIPETCGGQVIQILSRRSVESRGGGC